ncbi:hypothetical protein ACFVS2_26700 [Brevibacillus sp. NPDC058079]|uniref:hypothetical protein n=1 Tax=Brevibacillus sp. NPDC058079 TaxID=3346330 RepID=UPI0036EEE26C
MKDRNYLLTYQDEKRGYGTFAWFETEDEMTEYIENNRVHVIEALKIKDAEIIR